MVTHTAFFWSSPEKCRNHRKYEENSKKNRKYHTVDGRNPAPVDIRKSTRTGRCRGRNTSGGYMNLALAGGQFMPKHRKTGPQHPPRGAMGASRIARIIALPYEFCASFSSKVLPSTKCFAQHLQRPQRFQCLQCLQPVCTCSYVIVLKLQIFGLYLVLACA